MKRTLSFLLGVLLLVTTAVQAQFTYITNNGAITITGYIGGDAVVIPSTTNGYPITSIGSEAFYGSSLTSVTIPNSVTSIGQEAFIWCQSLTNITIPSSVTNIGVAPFMDCTSLTAITVAAQNPFYSSTNGVLFNNSQTTLLEYPGGSGGSYVIPAGVTNIGADAFFYCESLTSVTVPSSVTSIAENSFADCYTSLMAVYFEGNAPSADSTVFSYDYDLIAVYYLSGTTGWGATFAGVSAVEEAANYMVMVSASPSAGGTVSGGGSFASFNLKTVTATADSGYTFANWTENGFVVSPADPYNFTLIGNRNLVANFTANPVIYTVIVSASPDADGTVGGGGTFVSGTSQTVTATANSGYTFANWTEGGNVVSSSASYTFTLGSNRNLVANYIASPFVLYVPSSFGFISTVTSADVVGTLVKYFGSPGALVVDQNGNLYAAAGNVYKFTPAGAMSTFASGFSEPTGLAFDGSGNLYVADFEYGTISKVTPAGVVSAFAAGFPSDPHLGGNGTLSLACDGNGNVYLADYGSGIVWKITPAGVVSTFASGFCTTLSMASDAGGNLYLANFYGTVAKITPAGVVSTLASLSGYVTGLAFDGGGNLYASSTIAGAISRITTAGVVSTFASGFSGPIAIASAPTPPTVTTQPQNQGFINGQSVAAKFGIGASGQGISYQWQVSTNSGATWIPLTNSTNYNGVTTATLTVTGITPAISGCEYECVVTNALGSAISDPATLASVPFLMYVANQYNGNVAEATGTGVENLFTSGFSNPEGLALDGGGNLYVANQGNGTVSKVTPAGVATTIASGLSEPQGLAFDGSGNLYVANYGNGVVSEITPAGVVSIFASGFNEPTGLAFDGNGNLYVANYGNGKVSEVTPAGGVTPFASAFNNPISLAFDGGGNLYVADYGNGTIFEVAPRGGVSIIAGGFSNPRGLAFDGSGNLYVTEGLAVYGDGSFYVWDYGNGPVSEVTPAGVVTTYTPPISVLSAVAIATAPTPPIITIQPTNVTVPAGEAAIFSIDVGGAPGSNTFQWQISTDGGMTWTPLYNNATYSGVASPTLTVGGTTGNLSCQYECVVANTVGSATSNPATLTWLPFLMYVANYGNNTVSQVAPNGVVSPFAGGFSYPKALALDGNGNLYVANAGNNTISKVTPAGVVGVFASGITNATALAVDGSGNVYVACEGSGTILKVTPAGLAGVFAGGFANPTALALDRNGNLYVADYSADTVSKITPAGVASAFASGVLNPEGMAFDGSGNLYVTEVAGTVCKITPGGAVSAFASGFSDPQGMAFDGSGNLYVANYGNYTVSKVTPAGGVSAFVSGFNDPTGIAIMTAPAPLTTTNYTITVSASPGAGGTVSGGGAFAPGSSSWQTVIATVNSGYIFANWTENGNVVSWAPAYDVLLNSNVNLVANFIKISYQTLDEPLAASASGAGTYASGISGSNFVGYYTAPNGSTFGFLYNGGAWTTLDDPLAFGDTTPSGISGANIVGSYANDSFHGFLYSGGTYTTFSYFDGLYGNAHANGIDGAYVVGSFPDDSGTHGFLYNGSTYTTLDDPNSIPVYNNGYLQTGAYTVADGISRNTIVGSYAIPSFVGLGISHGFLYANGSYTTLDVPNATGGTYVNGIDGSNIVGYYIDSAEKTHGFLYNGTNYTTLDDPNGVGSTYAFGISGNTIVGYYDDSNNVAHGFVATFPSNVYDTMLVSASPNGGGTVSGGGTFASGSTQTVTAAANSGYTFANWTENGIVMSSATNYSFTLNSNVTLVANFTVNPGYYAISVIASPGAGGMVSGGGAFVSGSSQTVTATASTGYTFTNWTENGSMVSSSPSYSFTLNSNVNLVAHFTVNPVTYTVTVSASPGAGGTVSGGGTFVLGSSQTVTATPNSGYLFVNWTQNGVLVSASPSYSFTLYGNLNLVANFKVNTVPPPTVVWIQPTTSSLAITAGTNVTFSVSAAGTGPFSYQWQLNGSNLPNGVITTVAGGGGNYPGNGGPATNAALYEPGSVTLDAAGNLFFVDEGNERICKVGTNGILTTVAGKGGYGYTGDGGPATNATLNYPDGLAVDAAGNLFFADSSNYRIRKVGTNGIITTVAGNGTQGYSGDGSAATNAELWGPTGVAADADGNVFFGDSYNNVIRKLGTNGIITTVVGNGYEAGTGYGGYTGDGGPAIDAELWGPSGVAVAPNGNLFFSDESNQRIREVGTNGIITTVAGGGGNYPGDGGAATNAQLDFPYDVTADASGNVFIADQFHQRVRKVDANGIISTVAGDGAAGYSGDGGAATNAELAEPLGVALDSNGDLFIGVEFNSRIREVVFSGPTLVLNDVGVSNAGAYDVVVSSPYGSVTSSVVNLTVTLPLQVTTVLLPNGTDGSSYSQQLSATNGHPPYSWSLLSGLLPSGLTLTTSGLISGAPTTDGTFNFTVEVTDASADAATQALALTVPSLPSVVIQPTNNPLLVAAGSNVTFYASVSGPGPFSYNWQLDGTNLPHGIGIITTVAGDGPTSPATGGYSGDGSAATNAGLNGPQGVRLDAAGNIFIADSGNHRVRKVGLNGIITTVAGNGIYGFSGDGQAATNAQLWQPYGVAVDAAGNLFVSDLLNTDVRKVGTNGIITTVAGNGSAGYSGDGGPATNAEMHWPEGIAVDASGNLFIADSGNQCIRKVGTNGIITTVAGDGTYGFSGDGGAAVNAQLDNPDAVTVDGSGNLFISDEGNQRIRKVGINGIITTVAGDGYAGDFGDGGPAIDAEFADPAGMAVDATGNLFIADIYDSRVREVGLSGIITTAAGAGENAYSGDGGPATSAELFYPEDVAVDAGGNLYIADYYNNRIRKVTYQGATLVLSNLGSANSGAYTVVVSNPFGSVTSSVVNLVITTPLQITTPSLPNGTNNVAYSQALTASGGQPPYSWTNVSGALPPGLALATNGVISGVPTTNGTFDFTVKVTDTLGGTATQALALTVPSLPGVIWIQPTNSPVAVAVGSNVSFSVSVTGAGPFSYQWQLNGTNLPNGIISTVAGNGTGGYSGDGGAATNAELYYAYRVAVDDAGNLFISDTGNYRVRKVGTNGIISTVAGNGTGGYSGDGGAATNAGLYGPRNVAIDAAGNLFIADYGSERIRKVGTNGIITTVAGNGTIGYSGDGGAATNAEFYYPDDVAMDAMGNLFIADQGNNRIRKVGTNGIISTVAGNGIRGYSGDGSAAANAELNQPFAVTLDTTGDLFLSDWINNRVRKVGTNGIITTLAGNGTNGYSGDGGVATNAEMASADGLALDFTGNLFIADAGNNRIRRVEPSGVIMTVAGNSGYGYSGDGGAATSSTLYSPVGVAVDAAGNLFIADTYNNRIRKVVFQGPSLALNSVGVSNVGAYDVVVSNPYGSVTSSVVNLTIQTPLQVTTVSLPIGTNGAAYNQTLAASGGQPPYSWTNISGALPAGLALASNGVISGAPTTNGTFDFTVKVTDTLGETATQALALTVPSLPGVIWVQPTNSSVAVAIGSNVTFSVSVTGTGPFSYQWQLNGTNLPNGIISTVAGDRTEGYSGDGGAATNAELYYPGDVAVDAIGNLFIVDDNNYRIRKVGTNGIITTVAGNGTNGYAGDGGAATNAELSPSGVAVDATGNLYIADFGNYRIRKVGTNGIITTVAGNGGYGYSGDGGAATNAEFIYPYGVAVDAAGNLFIADRGNNRIRKVGTNGVIITVAGNGYFNPSTGAGGYSGDGGAATSAELSFPEGVAVDPIGNLFIADVFNYRIRKVGTNGIITTVAGNGYTNQSGGGGYSGDGGAATNAELYYPVGVAADSTGNLFIADTYNYRIRKVGANGIITTVAGNGGYGYSGDGGAATNAELNEPYSAAVDVTGNLFIADIDNNRTRKVVFHGPTLVLTNVGAANIGAYDVVVSNPYGTVTSSVVNLIIAAPLQMTTVSVSNGTNGAAYNQTLAASGGQSPYIWTNVSGALPPGLALASNGVISGVPTTNGTFNFTVKVTDTLGGTATQALALTVIGLPSVAIQTTNNPVFVAVGSNVTLGVSVTGTGPFSYQWQLNGTNIPSGIITTVAGNGTAGYSGDRGAATNAELYAPLGVAVDAAGNLFIADFYYSRIRKVGTNGIITTVAGGGSSGLGDGGAATNAGLVGPEGVAVDAHGNLFIADRDNQRIRKVGTNGIITTVAGNGTLGYSGDGGAATNAKLADPFDVAVDAAGNLFIADYGTSHIRKVDTNGIITTVAGNGSFGNSGDGGAATNAEFNSLTGVAIDATGNLFIADYESERIRMVGANGIISTVAGNGTAGYSGDGGAATNAELYNPKGAGVDANGNLFIADEYNNVVREVRTNGIISTVAGNGYDAGTANGGYSGDGGVATHAELYAPFRVAADAAGNLYIADSGNNVIRKVTNQGLAVTGPTLALNNVGFGNTGAYDVVVSSPYGSVTSSVVNLTVTTPPVLSAGGFNTSGGLQLSIYGQTGQAYTLQASTNLVNWVSILNFTCTNSPTYVVDPAAKNFRFRFYRLAQGTLLVPASPVVLGFGSAQPLSSNGLALMLQGPVGSNYVIQASTDLVTWLPVTNFVSTNSPFYFNFPTATNYSHRFYRAVIP